MAIEFLDPQGADVIGDDHGIPASVIFADFDPGGGPRLHKHAYAELFFVIEGEATFTDGESEQTVMAGGVAIAPPDQPHAFTNTGSGRLRSINIHLSPRFVTEWLQDQAQRGARERRDSNPRPPA